MSWLKLARRTAGVALFVAGVFSLILPIIPGWLLVLFGLYLLSVDSPAVRTRLDALCSRYPLLERIRQSSRRMCKRKRPHKDAE